MKLLQSEISVIDGQIEIQRGYLMAHSKGTPGSGGCYLAHIFLLNTKVLLPIIGI